MGRIRRQNISALSQNQQQWLGDVRRLFKRPCVHRSASASVC
jgi:hypothetical protein